jgi:hypothetical protein
MRTKLIALGLAAAITCGSSLAADPILVPGGPMVMGSYSCGAWVQNRANGGVSAELTQGWLLGFMSGLATASRTDILKGRDPTSLYLWIDNYCRANPLQYTDDAGQMLYFEIQKSMMKSAK